MKFLFGVSILLIGKKRRRKRQKTKLNQASQLQCYFNWLVLIISFKPQRLDSMKSRIAAKTFIGSSSWISLTCHRRIFLCYDFRNRKRSIEWRESTILIVWKSKPKYLSGKFVNAAIFNKLSKLLTLYIRASSFQ